MAKLLALSALIHSTSASEAGAVASDKVKYQCNTITGSISLAALDNAEGNVNHELRSLLRMLYDDDQQQQEADRSEYLLLVSGCAELPQIFAWINQHVPPKGGAAGGGGGGPAPWDGQATQLAQPLVEGASGVAMLKNSGATIADIELVTQLPAAGSTERTELLGMPELRKLFFAGRYLMLDRLVAIVEAAMAAQLSMLLRDPSVDAQAIGTFCGLEGTPKDWRDALTRMNQERDEMERLKANAKLSAEGAAAAARAFIDSGGAGVARHARAQRREAAKDPEVIGGGGGGGARALAADYRPAETRPSWAQTGFGSLRSDSRHNPLAAAEE